VVCAPPVCVPRPPVCADAGYTIVNFGGSPQAFGYIAADGHYIHHPIQYEHQQEHRERVQYLRATRW